jgi:hypothetical protein
VRGLRFSRVRDVERIGSTGTRLILDLLFCSAATARAGGQVVLATDTVAVQLLHHRPPAECSPRLMADFMAATFTRERESTMGVDAVTGVWQS